MNKQLKGSSFIILSAFFYATYGIWSKLMIGAFGEFSQAWTRGLILLMILIPFGLFAKQFKQIKKRDFIWFLVISLCGGLNQAPYFYGFEHLSVGTATLLFYMMLTFGTYIIGKFFFSEELTSIKYLSLVIAIIGLSILYKFSISTNQIFPALATMTAGLMGSAVVVFTKKLSSDYSETQILTSMFVLMVICNIIISFIIRDKVPSLENISAWHAQGGYILAMLLANGAVIVGFKYLEPSIGGLLGLLEVVFGVIFGILFFREQLTMFTVAGGGLIILSAALPDIWSLRKRVISNQ